MADAAVDYGLEVYVYGHNDPTTPLDILPLRTEPTYLEEMKDVGGGTVVVNLLDPKYIANPELLDYRNILRVCSAGHTVGGFIIQKKTTTRIADDATGENIAISGEGLRTWLNDAAVYPEGGLQLTSLDNRSFTFASAQGDWYDSSDWIAPVVVKPYDQTGADLTSPWVYAPADWPDVPNASWVWDRDSHLSAPAGNAYFRFEFDAAAAGSYSLFLAADDQYFVYIDGALSTQSDSTTTAWTSVAEVDFTVTEGHHVVGIRVAHWKDNTPAALLAAVFKAGDPDATTPTPAYLIGYTGATSSSTSKDVTTATAAVTAQHAVWAALSAGADKDAALVLLNELTVVETEATAYHTYVVSHGSGWLMDAYPAAVPGWSPGEIMLTLLAEAETRGVLFPTWLTSTFTATEDSYGNTWDTSLDWSFTMGSSYEAVLEQMEEIVCDAWIEWDDDGTIKFNMVAERGIDRSVFTFNSSTGASEITPVTFIDGHNLGASSIDGVGDITNALIVQTTDGYVEIDDTSGSIATYGRIESNLDTGASASVSQSVAEIVFAHKADAEQGASYNINPTFGGGDFPWVDFGVGDWVLAPDELGTQVRRKVMSISIAEDEDSGVSQFTLEFDTIFQDDDTKLTDWLTKLSGGALTGSTSNAGGGSSAPSGSVTIQPPAPSLPSYPMAPINVAASATGIWSVDGVTGYAAVTLTWTAVTGNTDGTPTTPLQYEVWGKLTGTAAAFQRFAVTSDLTVVVSPFQPNSEWEFEVRAQNPSGTFGAFSDPADVTMPAPSLALDPPTDPNLTTFRGLIIASWDGNLLASDGTAYPAPPFMANINIYASVDGGTTYQLVGSMQAGTQTTTLGSFGIGSDIFIEFTAVDALGNETAPSDAVDIVVEGIDGADLIVDTINGNDIIAGSIEVDRVSPAFGSQLAIDGNVVITAVQAGVAAAQTTANAGVAAAAAAKQIYNFSPTGAIISSPGSQYSVSISNTEMDFNAAGVRQAWLDAAGFNAPQMVTTALVLTHHVIEDDPGGSGTVVKRIS